MINWINLFTNPYSNVWWMKSLNSRNGWWRTVWWSVSDMLVALGMVCNTGVKIRYRGMERLLASTLHSLARGCGGRDQPWAATGQSSSQHSSWPPWPPLGYISTIILLCHPPAGPAIANCCYLDHTYLVIFQNVLENVKWKLSID